MRPLCKKCSRPLPERQTGSGRPNVYCSSTCRRAAGYEIARVTRAINNLEGCLSQSRTATMPTIAMMFPEHLPLIEAELALQRERLHELLLEPEEKAL
jgi:hypothetical protein